MLINNAGVGGIEVTTTVDGYETIFATNHLGNSFFFAHAYLRERERQRDRQTERERERDRETERWICVCIFIFHFLYLSVLIFFRSLFTYNFTAGQTRAR